MRLLTVLHNLVTLIDMEFLQMVLLSALIVLVGVLIFCIIQAVYILIEMRKTAEKINDIMDNAVKISESVAEPISQLGTMVNGIKAGSVLMGAIKVINWLRKKKGKEEDGE